MMLKILGSIFLANLPVLPVGMPLLSKENASGSLNDKPSFVQWGKHLNFTLVVSRHLQNVVPDTVGGDFLPLSLCSPLPRPLGLSGDFQPAVSTLCILEPKTSLRSGLSPGQSNRTLTSFLKGLSHCNSRGHQDPPQGGPPLTCSLSLLTTPP